jgi:hypothetical protein
LKARAAAASTFALALTLAPGPSARAIGLEGPGEADQRVGAGLAAGFDQVGGIGRDGFPFGEVFGHADLRLGRWLALGAGLSVRGDIADYNYALGRWRGRSAAITAQVTLGYDGPRFHLSAGSWLFGNDRDGRDFRAALLPYGVVRLRAGSLDRWHFMLHIADGAPFTAEGAGTGVRLLLGAPPRGAHRLAAGAYTSLGEKTVGLAVTDELAGAGPAGAALRVGGLAGVNWDNPGSRPELTMFAGLVW